MKSPCLFTYLRLQDWKKSAGREKNNRKEVQDGQSVLFPIRLDSAVQTTEQAWAAHINSTFHIGDFTYWQQTDAYLPALARLLCDLKVDS